MISVSPSSTRPSLLAFGAVALIALLTGMAIGAGPLTSDASGTPVPSGGDSPAMTAPMPIPTTVATPLLTRAPATPAPTQSTCYLPSQLPLARDPVATPAIEAGGLGLAFASHLYTANPGGVAVQDQPDGDWAMGLWFVAPGSSQVRLLPAPENGMVLPLAISPAGDRVALWWLPQLRGIRELPCVGGIYVLTVAAGRTDLVVRGDWTFEPDGRGGDDGWDWRDPISATNDERIYDLPDAVFSSDGRYLALVDGHDITIYTTGEAETGGVEPVARHTGACSEWAWAAARATFVAGCEDMTTAWWVKVENGLEQRMIALPPSPFAQKYSGWEPPVGRSIGLTWDGQIRVARFYGFPTGCEDPGCTIPPIAYGVTTIDPSTGAATHHTTAVDFIVEYGLDDSTWFSADASWVLAILADGHGAAVAKIGTGALPTPTRLGALLSWTAAGASPDGSALYGWRADDGVVVALGATGPPRVVVVIGHPSGVLSESPLIATFGLRVAAPSP